MKLENSMIRFQPTFNVLRSFSSRTLCSNSWHSLQSSFSWTTSSPTHQHHRRVPPSSHLPLKQSLCMSSSSAAAAAAPSKTSQSSSTTNDSPSQLFLYNTRSKRKELFQPRPDQGNAISMYVCGVTVYDYSHIGHARAYVAFDILYRTLASLGYKVTYVRNFTDVDDKIIARAAVTQEDPLALAARFADEFRTDMKSLNCLPPTLEPKATEYIPQMIEMIQDIIRNGHAYVAGDDDSNSSSSSSRDVFFDVESLPGYGQLSGRSLEDNRAGERVAVDDRKKGAADFALWKSAKPGEPTWDSPWGPGRPGWHIECSAMIKNVLGSVIDIHGGGRDLVFPHHENELAQSRAAEGPCGCGNDHHHHHSHQGSDNNGTDSSTTDNEPPFVRYWVHNGFVNVDSEKMSKSLGNFFTIRDVIQQYHPLALRWFLVNTQYRQPVNYTQRALEEASDRLYYLYQTIIDVNGAVEGEEAKEKVGSGGVCVEAEEMVAEARAALVDDLNTPSAVASLSAPLKTVNDLIHTKKGKKAPGRMAQLVGYRAALHEVLELLGLWTERPGDVLEEMRELALKRSGLSESEVEAAIEERAAARAAKDFAAADAVREKLEKCGIAIMDTPAGTTWRERPRSY